MAGEPVGFMADVLAGMKDRIPHEERALLMGKILELLHETEELAKDSANYSFEKLYSLFDATGADYERWQGEFEMDSLTFAQRFVASWSYVEASLLMLFAVGEVDSQDPLFTDLVKMAETEMLQMLDIFAAPQPGGEDLGMGLTEEEWQWLAPAMARLGEAVVEARIDVDEAWEATEVRRALDEFKGVFDYRTYFEKYAMEKVGRRYQSKPGLVKAILCLEAAIWLRERGCDWQMVENCLNGAAGLLSRVYTTGMIEYNHA